MDIEYLVFNLIIISGPMTLSFDRKVAFYKKWKFIYAAIFITMIPFIIWDAIVTGRHWWFNEKYTLDFKPAGLPIGELLFFIAVPYALLFVWEVFAAYFKNREIQFLYSIRNIAQFLVIPGLALFYIGKEYTGLVFFALAFTAFLDRLFKTKVFVQKRTGQLVLLNIGLNLIFNGYLTARPVVLYNEIYQFDWRIYTIPIEDIVYGTSMLLLLVIVYERLKGRSIG